MEKETTIREADNLDNTTINEGIHNVIILLISLDLKRHILDNNELRWQKEDYVENGERYITLREIYQQLKKKGHEGIIYVWEETPLSGTIYLCGNYEEGQWVEHGTTRGYA